MALASVARLLFRNGTRFGTKSSPSSLFSACSCSAALPLSTSVGGPPAAPSCSAPAAPGGDPPAAPTPTPASKSGVTVAVAVAGKEDPLVEPLPDLRIKVSTVPQAPPASPNSSCAQGDDSSPAVATGSDPSATPRVPFSGDCPYAPEVGPDSPKPQPGGGTGRSSSNEPLPDIKAAPPIMRSQGGDPLADLGPYDCNSRSRQ